MMALPFPRAELTRPLRFKYNKNEFNISIDGESIGTFKFCLSIAKDITHIESAIDIFLTSNPQYIKFYSESDVECEGKIRIPDGAQLIFNHLEKWCDHWHINMDGFATLSKIVDKFGNNNVPLAFKLYEDYNYNYIYNDNIYSIDFNGNFINTIYNNINASTTPSVRTWNLVPEFDLDYDFDIIMYPRNLHESDNQLDSIDNVSIIDMETISLSILTNRLIPLIALRCINNKLEYILDDILSMSKAKYSYFIMCLNDVFKLHKSTAIDLYNELHTRYETDIELLNTDIIHSLSDNNQVLYKLFYDRAGIIADIPNTIPTLIEKFPFQFQEFAIPHISAIPQTPLQWMMTNILAQKDIEIKTHFDKLEMGFRKDVKYNTKKLIYAIHCSDKALSMFLKYQHVLDEDGKLIYNVVNTSASVYEHGLDEHQLKKYCESMIEFIADGERIFNEYREPIEIEGVGIIKMAPINGTYLKKIRNSIYNHRMENKVTLDYKLQQLRKNDATDNQMTCGYSVPDILEECRIKYKDEMILLGSTLKHCLGNYIHSNDLFFRRESVCAQVIIPDFTLGQCYDRNNKPTVASKSFGKWIEMQLDLWYAREIHKEITDNTGIRLNEFETHIDAVRTYVKNKQRTVPFNDIVTHVNTLQHEPSLINVNNNDHVQFIVNPH